MGTFISDILEDILQRDQNKPGLGDLLMGRIVSIQTLYVGILILSTSECGCI